MARRGGRRGRRRGRRGSTRSKASSSKSRKSTRSRRARSTAASKRKSVRSKAKASRARRRSLSTKSKAKTKKKGFKSRVKSIRKSIGKTVGKVKKGFSMGRKAYGKVGKAIGKSFKGAAARAGTLSNTKPKSKLQTQISNFRNRVKQLSTPEAKKERRMKRLYNQHGLDYSRMNDSFKANVNVSQAYKHLGLDKNRITRSIYGSLPKAVKNFSWSHQFKSPTKLGARDGWHRGKYNSTGKGQGINDIPRETIGVPGGIVRDVIGGQQQRQAAQAQAQQQEQAALRQNDYNVAQYEASKRAFRKPSRQLQMGPQQDWLGSLYSSHNISGGKLDQGARDYWSNEAKTKGRDAVSRSIIGTSKAQGTYGGRKRKQTINTGSKRRGGGGIWGLGAALASRGFKGKLRGRRGSIGKTLAASTAALGLRGG